MYGGGAAAFQQRQMAAEKEAEMDGKEDSPPKRNSQLNHNRIMPADKVEKDEALHRMSTLDSFYHDVNAHGMLRKAARRRRIASHAVTVRSLKQVRITPPRVPSTALPARGASIKTARRRTST